MSPVSSDCFPREVSLQPLLLVRRQISCMGTGTRPISQSLSPKAQSQCCAAQWRNRKETAWQQQDAREREKAPQVTSPLSKLPVSVVTQFKYSRPLTSWASIMVLTLICFSTADHTLRARNRAVTMVTCSTLGYHRGDQASPMTTLYSAGFLQPRACAQQ